MVARVSKNMSTHFLFRGQHTHSELWGQAHSKCGPKYRLRQERERERQGAKEREKERLRWKEEGNSRVYTN